MKENINPYSAQPLHISAYSVPGIIQALMTGGDTPPAVFAHGLSHCLTIDAIVGRIFGVTKSDIYGASRKELIVIARHTCFYVLRKYFGVSYRIIAAHYGNRNHATAMHGVKNISKLIETRHSYSLFVKEVEKELQCVGMIEKIQSPSR